MNLYNSLLNQFLNEISECNYSKQIEIIKEFCLRNNLSGIDGLHGMLNYIEKLDFELCSTAQEHTELLMSFGEIAFLIWAFSKLERTDIPDSKAGNLNTGGNFGDTSSYLGSEGNYFRNFELELHICLRFLENDSVLITGKKSEPDFYINDCYVIEVKSPASILGLIQAILKGIQQIYNSHKPGIIILCLDHMVARNMIDFDDGAIIGSLSEIISSLLPDINRCQVCAIITEVVNWDNNSNAIVQVFCLDYVLDQSNSKEIILNAWSALSFDEIGEIFPVEQNIIFNFPSNINDIAPTMDGVNHLKSNWPDL